MNDEIVEDAVLEPIEAADSAPPPQSLADSALEAVGLPTQETDDKPEAKQVDAPDEIKPPADKKPSDGKAITEEDLQRPENLTHKSRDRFEKIASGYKIERARADDAVGQLSQMQESFKALQDLGFKDEASAGDLIEFSKYRASLGGDGKDAIQILQKQIRMIEMRTGQNVQASALETHNDLAEEVRSERLPYSRALEIAKARDAEQAQATQNQQYQQRQQQDFQSQQALQNSVQGVEALEANWRATDPDYSAIHPHLMAQIPAIQKQFPPNQWPAQVQMLYGATKAALSSQPRPGAYGNTSQPLRGNGHAASRAIPKSASEAALLSLGFEID